MTQTCNKLRETFDGLAPKTAEGLPTAEAPLTHFSMSAFQTNSCLPRDKDGKELEREYTASTAFTAIFRDFKKLGEVTSLLYRTPHVEIKKTEWRLTDATIRGLGSESRKAAVRDAMQKAKDFAEVLERVPVAIEVNDYGGQSYAVASQELGGYAPAPAASKQQIDGLTLEPEQVELTARISVKFQAD